jgi:hypothetical protein
LAKLALAAGEGAQFRGSTVYLLLDRRTADAAARAGGDTVLIYRIIPKSLVTFLGEGRLAALDYGKDRGPIECRIENYRQFTTPEVSSAEAGMPRARTMLALSEERFSELVARSATPMESRSVEEATAPFVSTYITIRDQVLKAWHYRCAVTGNRFPAKDAPARLEVIAIRPRDMGGPLHVQNCLPLVASAAQAWRQGWIAVGPELDILAVQNRLDPDLLEQMRPDGRLLVPDRPERAPDPQHLAFHREHVFAHWGPS